MKRSGECRKDLAIRPVDDDDLPDPARRHRLHRFVRGSRRGQRDDGRRHHVGERRRQRLSGEHDTAQQVEQREHADRFPLAVDDDDRAHARLAHPCERRRKRLVGRTRHRFAANEARQRTRDRLLLGGTLRVVRRQLRERLLQRFRDRARAEPLELGREPPPLEEVVARQLEAERVFQRVVALRRWSARRQRPDGKAFAGAERRLGLDARVLDATADGAALDDIEMRRRAQTRRQNFAILGEIREPHPRNGERERVVRHPVERRVAAQELARRIDQEGWSLQNRTRATLFDWMPVPVAIATRQWAAAFAASIPVFCRA